MFRTFTLPLTTTYTSVWQLMVTAGFIDSLGNMLVFSVMNFAIVSDRCAEFDVRPVDSATGTTTYRDQQADPGVEQSLSNMSKRSNRNSICLKDYLFKSSVDDTDTEGIVVEMEYV